MPILSNQGQGTGYTNYIRFTYEDLQRESWRDSGTTLDVRKQIAVGKVGDIVSYALFFTDVAAVGAGDMVLTCGVTETGATIMATFDMDTGTAAVNSGTAMNNNRALFISDLNIWIRIQGSISSLTAGEWLVALKILSPFDIAK